MLMRRSQGPYPGVYRRGRSASGQGFFSAPWWRLLVWIVISVGALVLAAEIGIA
jgi:hypothetical protein